jgi:hypothetical protein
MILSFLFAGIAISSAMGSLFFPKQRLYLLYIWLVATVCFFFALP